MFSGHNPLTSTIQAVDDSQREAMRQGPRGVGQVPSVCHSPSICWRGGGGETCCKYLPLIHEAGNDIPVAPKLSCHLADSSRGCQSAVPEAGSGLDDPGRSSPQILSAICFGSMLLDWRQADARLFLVEPSNHPHLILVFPEQDTSYSRASGPVFGVLLDQQPTEAPAEPIWPLVRPQRS
ncbi:hypothetical protein LIA77_11694 [Sarocladium implicatum]|nr:hypothetical protein LIA77_11694 [Sarocladium implicatum]